jgi:FkbM family methyltransferase
MTSITEWLGRRFGGTRIYQRLRASPAYDMYWRLARPAVLRSRDEEVLFYRRLLQDLEPHGLIFDIGANHGYKVDIFLRLGARVLAVDPDPANVAVLRAKFEHLRLTTLPVTIVPKAISDRAGEIAFWMDQPGSAKNTVSQKWADSLRSDASRFGQALQFARSITVACSTLGELVAAYGAPHFVKIDVEGHELQVISGMNAPVPYLSFEVNLPDFLDEGIQCVWKLQDLCSESKFNYATTLSAGLRLSSWLPAAEFLDVLHRCREASIEIFCRSDALHPARERDPKP